jgi:hypothetical protein
MAVSSAATTTLRARGEGITGSRAAMPNSMPWKASEATMLRMLAVGTDQ